MIGPEGHIHCWTSPRKNHSANQKNASTKSLVERRCDFEVYALSVLGYLGSISAPDEATLKEEAHALQCTTAGPCNAIPTDLLRVGSTFGLGPDILGIHTLSLAARHRTASNSVALANGMAKINLILLHFCSQLRMKGEILEPTRYCTSLGSWWPTRQISAGQKRIGCHSLAPRRITKAGLCQTSVFARFQNSGAYRSLSHGTGSASYESCVMCFSPWAHCWFLTHPLQWSLYGTKISR